LLLATKGTTTGGKDGDKVGDKPAMTLFTINGPAKVGFEFKSSFKKQLLLLQYARNVVMKVPSDMLCLSMADNSINAVWDCKAISAA
jgi:hypothetical protein